MKILFTVHSYYPNKDGVQMVTQRLAEQLAAAGHQVRVLTSILPYTKPQETVNGVHIERIHLRTKYSMYWGNRKQYLLLMQQLCQHTDVLVNVCTQNAFTDLLLPHLQKLPCKKVLYMHGMHDFRWKAFQFRSLRAFVNKLWKDITWGWLYLSNRNHFKKYDSIIQLHPLDYGYQFFKKHFHLNGVILENTVENSFWEEKPASDHKPYFICVSNYFIDKNQQFLLEGFYKSKASRNYELILVGSQPSVYYQKLLEYNKQLQGNYGVRKVSFRYGLSRPETIQLIRGASLYLFSSLHEVYPLSIMEAMASGVAFISTDVGCVRAFPGGLLAHSPDDMARMIDLVSADKEMAVQLGKLGYYYARTHFQLDRQLEKFQKILQ